MNTFTSEKANINRAGTRKLIFTNDKVIKIQDKDKSKREFFKTIAGKKIGEETGLFYVPDVKLESDKALEFNRIWGLVSLRSILSISNNPYQLSRRVGLSLAEIHNRLFLSDENKINLKFPSLCEGGSKVFFHGDYSTENVLYDSENDRLVIIDWALPYWLGEKGTYGMPYVDVSIMIQSLFRDRILSGNAKYDCSGCARSFLKGYAEVSRNTFIVSDFKRAYPVIIEPLLRRQRKKMGLLKYLAYYPNVIKASHFVKSCLI